MLFLFISCDGPTPMKKEISGRWISEDGAAINLSEDGSFTALALPAELFFNHSAKYMGVRFDGSGKWVIKTDKKSWDQLPWSVDLNFEKTSDSEYLCNHSLLISGTGLMENKSPWNNLFLWKEEEGSTRYLFKRM